MGFKRRIIAIGETISFYFLKFVAFAQNKDQEKSYSQQDYANFELFRI
jgi:hypothetical protein